MSGAEQYFKACRAREASHSHRLNTRIRANLSKSQELRKKVKLTPAELLERMDTDIELVTLLFDLRDSLDRSRDLQNPLDPSPSETSEITLMFIDVLLDAVVVPGNKVGVSFPVVQLRRWAKERTERAVQLDLGHINACAIPA